MSEENAEQGSQCTATITMPDGLLRCALIAGHGPVTPFGDAVVALMATADHTAPHSGHPFWWRDTAGGATPAVHTSPCCPSVSAHGDVCTLTRGHEGPGHERHVAGERVASWIDPAESIEPPAPFCGQRNPDYPDGDCCTLPPGHRRWVDDGGGDVWDHVRLDASGEMITGWNVPAMPNPPQQMPWNSWRIVDDPKPVRVRFVNLPPRYEERNVLGGITATVAVPGGFALVVDRFRDQSDCADQRARWDDLGAKIGAHVVVCYPGELDIASWFDPS